MSIFSCCASNAEEVNLMSLKQKDPKAFDRTVAYLEGETPRTGYLFTNLEHYKNLGIKGREVNIVNSAVSDFSISRAGFFICSIIFIGADAFCWYILMSQLTANPPEKDATYLGVSVTSGCAISIFFIYIISYFYRYTRDSFNEMKEALIGTAPANPTLTRNGDV